MIKFLKASSYSNCFIMSDSITPLKTRTKPKSAIVNDISVPW